MQDIPSLKMRQGGFCRLKGIKADTSGALWTRMETRQRRLTAAAGMA